MRKFLTPFVSLLFTAGAIAAILFAVPVSAAPTLVNASCTESQGPDEFLPGVATTTLPTSGAVGTARVLTNARAIAFKLPSTAAGTCYVTTGPTTLDPTTLVTTGARGFDIVPGDGWTAIDLQRAPAVPIRVACTAQLVATKGLKIFQCR